MCLISILCTPLLLLLITKVRFLSSQGIKTYPKHSLCSRLKEAVLAVANIHKLKEACRPAHVGGIIHMLPQSAVAVLLAYRVNNRLSLVEQTNCKLAVDLHQVSPGTGSSYKISILSKTNC